MSSIIPTDFKFINMSTGRNENSNADQRKCTIRDILKNESPTLVFVEEFTWVGLHKGSAFSDIPTHYKYVGNEHAGFIYDSRDMDCERLDLKSSVRRSYGVSIAYRSSEINFDLPRLCICKIKSKGPPEFELLCVCWHGPHNNFSDEKKEKHLRSMLRFLLMIKVECGNLPLLLGGDFNLDSTEVNKVCKEVSPNLTIDAPLSSIMMWVHLPDFPKKFQVSASESIPYEYFDHYVLMMVVQVHTPVEDFRRRFTICRSSEEQTLVRETDYFKCSLNIKRIRDPGSNMISASWHGAYDEYSDKAKEESLRATIKFLLREVQKHVAGNTHIYPPLHGDVKLNVDWLLKDELTMENIHSCRNTLDTWTLSNNDKKLLKVKLENQRPMKWKNETHHLQRMSTPHPNGNPVDIHLDIVDLNLHCSGKYICTLDGYLKKCVYLQPKSPE